MSLVKGLTPFAEDAQGRTRLNPSPRSDVPNPNPLPSLSPVASPVNSGGGTPAPSNASRLAEALSALNPALQRFGDVQAQQTQDDMPGKLSAALTGKSLSDQRDILANNPDFQNRMAQNLGAQMLGQAQADSTLDNIRQQYTTGGYDHSQPLDSFINPFITTDLQGNTNPHFAEAYRSRMLAGVATLRDAEAKYQANQSLQNQDDMIFGSIKATVGQALDTNASPQDAYKAIRNTFSTVKAVANRPFNEQEQLLVQYLGQMADGLKTDPNYAKQYSLINGILNTPRVDPSTGQNVGSLIDSPSLGGAAAKVLNGARDAFNSRDQFDNYQVKSNIHTLATTADPSFKATLDATSKAHPQWFTPDEMVSLGDAYNAAQIKQRALLQTQAAKDTALSGGLAAAQRGQLWSVGDANYADADGKVVKYSGDDIRKDVINRFEQGLDNKYAAVANTPAGQASRFRDEVQFYSNNLVKNEDWERELKSAPGAASTVVAAGGQVPQSLNDAYNLYMNLRGASPQLLQQHVDEPSQDFFELARVAQQYHNLDTSQALQIAARATTDPNWNHAAPGLSKKDITDKVTSGLRTMWGTDLTDVWNSDKPATEVVEDATMLNRGLGIPLDAAIKEASQRVQQNYSIINNTAVRTGDKQVPPNFSDLANDYINTFYDAHKADIDKMGFDKSDITLLNIGDTPNWALTFKGHPAPISLPGANFSIPQLYTMQQHRNAAAEATVKTALQRKDEPAFQIGDPDTPFNLQVLPGTHAGAEQKFKRENKSFESDHFKTDDTNNPVPGL